MTQNDKFTIKHELRNIPHSHVRITKGRELGSLLPIKPYGLKSGDVEALSSYFCRLAEADSERTQPYRRKITRKYFTEDEQKSFLKVHPKSAPSINGCSKIGKDHVRLLSRVKEIDWSIESLTFQPLINLSGPSERGLKRSNLAWCKQCWIEDIAANRTPYVRLVWLFQNSQICVHHNKVLSNYCPACGESQSISPPFPRQWICHWCATELFKPAHRERSKFSKEEEWASRSIYRLLQRMLESDLSIEPDNYKKAILRVLETTNMRLETFCYRIQVEMNSLKKIIDQSTNPHFPSILDLCYRLNIPIDQFIFDNDILHSEASWRSAPQTAFYSQNRLTDKKKLAIQVKLTEYIRNNPAQPSRVGTIAQQLNTTKPILKYHFPAEYDELSRRFDLWEKNEFHQQHIERLEKISNAMFGLVRKSIFPTHRKLIDLDLVIPSDLRREDVLELLRAFQKIYSDLSMK